VARATYPRLQEPRAVEVEARRLDGLLDEVTVPVSAPRLFLKRKR
jgi:hypothetical protein